MKRLLLYIFIPVLAVLLMSHNVDAVSLVFDASQYTPNVRQVYNLVDCSFRQETGTVQVVSQESVSNCSLNQDSYKVKLTKIVTSNSITYKKGDIVEFDVINYIGNYSTSSSANVLNFSWNAFKLNDVTNFYLMGYDEVFYEANSNGSQFGYVNSALRFRVYVNNDVYSPIGLTATDVTYNPIATWQQISNGLKWNIINLTVYRKNKNTSVNEEQKEATQDAANNSATSGNSSSTNSQNATSSLLSVFTGFASVITNASATNCVINAPLNTSFSNDRLNVDLCSLSLPPALGALTSIIAVMVIVPFAISMFNKFVAIMESFQR